MSDALISRSAAINIVRNAEYSHPTWPHIVEAKEQMIMALECAPTVPAEVVVHCENCQHIHVLNTSEIYAICDKTNFVFQPFGVDTREFGCPYGKRRESEESK